MTLPYSHVLGLDGSFWMPKQGSTIAAPVDNLFMFIMWVTIFFFVLIAVVMAYFVIKYRYRPGREDPDPAPAHSTALEITWTIIPTIIVLVIFYYGFKGFLNESIAPPNSYEINVLSNQWSWAFQYPDGFISPDLHLPVNKPVQFILTSSDVIHSLFLPQFRAKKDVVPGRFNRFWIQPTEIGPSDIYCAEYCGTGHSTMLAKCYVQSENDFKAWVDDQKDWGKHMSLAQGGEMLIKNNGCLQCHNVDGVMKNAPSFKDLYGSQVPLSTGKSVPADDEYITRSIYEPAADVVQGYQVLMSSYKGRLKDRDVLAITTYMKTISSNYKGPPIDTKTLASAHATTMPSTAPGNQSSSSTMFPTTQPQIRQ